MTINGLVYNSIYHFRISGTTNSGRTNWVTIGPITCLKMVDRPQIKLPKILNRPVKIRVGRKLHLKIPFEAGPRATLKWQKIEKKAEIDLESHVKIHTVNDVTILFISSCQLWDSGKYKILLQDGDMEIVAFVNVFVLDFPSKPINLKITEITTSSTQLSWDPPQSNGNSEVHAYQIEKRDKRSSDWFVVYDKVKVSKIMLTLWRKMIKK
jgi:hypothetical protein